MKLSRLVLLVLLPTICCMSCKKDDPNIPGFYVDPAIPDLTVASRSIPTFMSGSKQVWKQGSLNLSLEVNTIPNGQTDYDQIAFQGATFATGVLAKKIKLQYKTSPEVIGTHDDYSIGISANGLSAQMNPITLKYIHYQSQWKDKTHFFFVPKEMLVLNFEDFLWKKAADTVLITSPPLNLRTAKLTGIGGEISGMAVVNDIFYPALAGIGVHTILANKMGFYDGTSTAKTATVSYVVTVIQ